jgi:ABC-type phosphate/phosphonate transport system substrate-binding protein
LDKHRNLIANARMYSVAPGADSAWKRLFAWLETASGVPLTVIDHAFPAPLDELWSRQDLACTFMCGWPYLRRGATHTVVAAPIPSADYAQDSPVYCSHFVVRADSPFRCLEDTFGNRFAFTVKDSHSGYNAPRHHLLKYRSGTARRLYREIVGPLMTPRRVLEAIIEKKTDVGPLDSFAYDLLRRHAPELASETRVVASTKTIAIPAFMAAKGTPAAIVERLADTLCGLKDQSELAFLRDDLCIVGFARLDPDIYHTAEQWAKEAEALGRDTIS